MPKLLAQYRKYALILVDELGYLPFSQTTAELLFQFFSDRYEPTSVALTSNLDFARWTEVFGNERMTAALLDQLVHRSHILLLEGESFRFRQLLLEGESFRFRQSLEQQAQAPAVTCGPARSSTRTGTLRADLGRKTGSAPQPPSLLPGPMRDV